MRQYVASLLPTSQCFSNATNTSFFATHLARRRLRSAKLSKGGSIGDGSSEYSPVSLNFIRMLPTNNKIVVERKRISVMDAVKDNMQTFYNPYAERRRKKEKTLVCMGEAYGLVVGFTNSLSIPLEIVGCNLLFGKGGSEASSKR